MKYDLAHYQLFLFDLDGLLINSEKIHWQAYVQAAKKWGHSLSWDFHTYCSYALKQSGGVRIAIEEGEPHMQPCIDRWSEFYQTKSDLVAEILQRDPIELMPGAELLLAWLKEHNKKCCVVTHSKLEFVSIIRKKQPLLDTITHWFTREDYSKPKPSPDGYLTAIKKLGEEGDKVIGFEDSPRGLTSLMGTTAQPVFVTPFDYPNLPQWKESGVIHLKSLESLHHE